MDSRIKQYTYLRSEGATHAEAIQTIQKETTQETITTQPQNNPQTIHPQDQQLIDYMFA
jgi:hypothetical protein